MAYVEHIYIEIGVIITFEEMEKKESENFTGMIHFHVLDTDLVTHKN